jgi:hypothetical protein
MKNNLPTIENRTIAQRNITTLDKIYDLALNGIGGISEPLGDFVSDYISRYGRTEKAIDKMVSAQKLKLTTSGFVTGLGGLITLPVTIPADLASSLYVEMRMIAAIASLRGYNIYSDQVKTLVYVCMVGNALGDVIKQAGIKTATQLTVKKLLPKLTREIIVKINKAVGFRLLTKGGSKGVINVGKAIPIIGGIVSGGFNYFEVEIYAQWAKKMFNENA